MRVSISTLTGVEVARLDTDATATLVDLLALLPNELDDIDYSRRIFFGETELKGDMNLSDIGVIEDSVLTVVFVPILRLLTASQDGTAKVWSGASGECLRTLEGHTGWVRSAVFSPDGQQVLTASFDKTAKVWSAASGECLRTLMGHTSQVKSAVFSPDGQQVLTASWDETAKVWSAASGECLRTLEGHTGCVLSAVFSPDGQQVLTASFDKTAKVWSAASGECLRTLEGHTSQVESAVFSPDGQQVLTASQDGTREGVGRLPRVNACAPWRATKTLSIL